MPLPSPLSPSRLIGGGDDEFKWSRV